MTFPTIPSLPAIPSLPTLPSFPSLPDIPQTVNPELATGLFGSGPDEAVATADIYNLKSAVGGAFKPITSIQELKAKIDINSLGVKLDAGIASDFLSKLKNGALSFDKDLLTSRILGTNSSFKAAFGELNGAMKQGALLSTYKDKAGSLLTTVNGVSSMVKSSNINDVRSLGNFVNNYTKSDLFSSVDRGAVSGLLSSVITTSSNLGVSGAFSAITETVTDHSILGSITRSILPVALKNSDTQLLRELSNSSVASMVTVFSPTFTTTFSKSFTYQGDRSNTLTSFKDILYSFGKINSQWNALSRAGGSPVLNLAVLAAGSRDFQKVIATGVKYWNTEQSAGNAPPVTVDPLYALAGAFSEITVSQAVKRDFPKVALLGSYNQKLPSNNGTPAGLRNGKNANMIDPRLVNGALAVLAQF